MKITRKDVGIKVFVTGMGGKYNREQQLHTVEKAGRVNIYLEGRHNPLKIIRNTDLCVVCSSCWSSGNVRIYLCEEDMRTDIKKMELEKWWHKYNNAYYTQELSFSQLTDIKKIIEG